MLKKSTSVTVCVYGVLLIGLGLLGYTQGKSLPSLIMGSGFGALLVVSSILIYFHQKIGAYSALAITLLLTGTFAYRYTMTGRSMAGILAVLSGAMLLFLLLRFVNWKR